MVNYMHWLAIATTVVAYQLDLQQNASLEPRGWVDWITGKIEGLTTRSDTYVGGSTSVFESGQTSTGVTAIEPDPVSWRELKGFVNGKFDHKYNDDDIIWEYYHQALHTGKPNTRYDVFCFCFPSETDLCSCGDFSRNKDQDGGLGSLTAAYLHHIQPATLYVENDPTPDERFMNLVSLSLYINGTFPARSKSEEKRDFKACQEKQEGRCYPVIEKNCRKS